MRYFVLFCVSSVLSLSILSGCSTTVTIDGGKYAIPVDWIELPLRRAKKYEKMMFIGKTPPEFEIGISDYGLIGLYSVLDAPRVFPEDLRGMAGHLFVPLYYSREKYIIVRTGVKEEFGTYTPVFVRERKKGSVFLKIDAYYNCYFKYYNREEKEKKWLLIAEIPEKEAIMPKGMGRDELVVIFDEKGLFVRRPLDRRFRGYKWPDNNVVYPSLQLNGNLDECNGYNGLE